MAVRGSFARLAGVSLMMFAVAGMPCGAQTGTPTFRTEDAPTRSGPSDTASPSSTATIEWQTSYDVARQVVHPGQVIFVDVYTNWCSWCHYMDSKIYSDTAVRQLASQHVFVKLDAEDGMEGETFARKAGVSSYPTLLVYTTDGRLIGQMSGAFRKPGDFMRWMDKVLAHR